LFIFINWSYNFDPNDFFHFFFVQLDAGADIEYVGAYGATSLSIAAEEGVVGAVQLLLDLGANPNAVRYTTSAMPLHLACAKGLLFSFHHLSLKDWNASKQNNRIWLL
jgi:ankyrin repeat protein